MPKLVNLGSACVDHVYRVTELVAAGETASSLSHEVFPGGKGLNQSLAAAKAGAVVHHLGAIGQDGALLRQVLLDAGVDVTGLVERSDVASGHAVIQVNDRGENAIVIAGGANRTITDADRIAAGALLSAGDWLLLQPNHHRGRRVTAWSSTFRPYVLLTLQAFNQLTGDGRTLNSILNYIFFLTFQ